MNPHDLGLVIIDEEQRFGVGHKEQLKNLRESIDVLTLSATPIPRTMQMSLSGVRDMSLILTPPDERRPVEVHVGEWDPDLVSAAIRRELARGGRCTTCPTACAPWRRPWVAWRRPPARRAWAWRTGRCRRRSSSA